MGAQSPPRRVSRSKRQAKVYYDRLSRWYDWVAGSAERRLRALGLRRLEASRGDVVLEIGYGTGAAVLELARAVGPTGRVAGIDLSVGMAGVARRKLTRSGLAPRVDLRVGDAVELPYAADTFDAAFMSFTLELFDTPEIPRVLSECVRVLRPGGRLVVVSLAKRGGRLEHLYERLHDRFPVLIDCRPIPVQELIRAAGLTISTVDGDRLWGLPVAIVSARAIGTD